MFKTSFFLWTSKGKTFEVLRLLDDMVRVQISPQPDKNNYGKYDKARTVFYCCKKGKQKNPEDNIISYPNKSKGVTVPLFN